MSYVRGEEQFWFILRCIPEFCRKKILRNIRFLVTLSPTWTHIGIWDLWILYHNWRKQSMISGSENGRWNENTTRKLTSYQQLRQTFERFACSQKDQNLKLCWANGCLPECLSVSLTKYLIIIFRSRGHPVVLWIIIILNIYRQHNNIACGLYSGYQFRSKF